MLTSRETTNEKELIVHLFNKSSFIDDYILFMENHFDKFDHMFVIEGDSEGIEKNEKIIFIDSYLNYTNKNNIALYRKIKEAKKIIISGLFSNRLNLLFFLFPNSILKKTYIQFWGGDFYVYNRVVPFYHIKYHLLLFIKKNIITRSAGIINLISEDYDMLVRIMKITNKKHFVAPVPAESNPYKHIISGNKVSDRIQVLVGNSATETNGHHEAFTQLIPHSSYIDVHCPLSYGDNDYADQICSEGKSLFGEHFFPVKDLMSKEDYIRFLSTMDLGIFANNRQQALGNILIMLMTGKKVYLRKNTTMWKNFLNTEKIKVFDFSDISTLSHDELSALSEEDKKNNAERANLYLYGSDRIMKWNKVFSD